ncbi:MAG: 16S rRNA (cytosine(1402)-N(4))-methyltransferase RsmH [Alphaproteobacteria bacterium]|jgi:16S rRNA (cytosine1402-N4)-methyltransferase|nr:16S rRNA (cytosine(1402)-N(4))-methyltransferase RsmH [Alphaproteobacteria bacterium]
MAARSTRQPHNSGVSATPGHIPVLLNEVIDALNPRDGGIYIDGTLGGGGYARAILDAANCTVLGIDRDPDAIARNEPLLEIYGARLQLIPGRFGDLDSLVRCLGFDAVDGVTLDLGVSSPQIDIAERGFSFAKNGPLDMRMEQSGESAADVVNTASESDLAFIVRTLGEERHARRVARAIVQARTEEEITTTEQLANIVRGVVPKSRKTHTDPATRTFQAIRIHVNDEIGELKRGLVGAEQILRPEGRLAVVSFHSLEDRPVKAFLRTRSGGDGRGSRHMPDAPAGRDSSWRLPTRRAIKPGDSETGINPRARSARLRVGERTDAPAWGAMNEEDAG